MSVTLGLHTTYATRQSSDIYPRSIAGMRILTPRPDDRSCLVFLTDPAGLAVEQYNILRRRVRHLHPQGGTMLVTSPGVGEGKTLTSINLAWCLAEAGQQTCLVDLDFRAPGVARALGLTIEEDGVEDILMGKRTVLQSVRQVGDRPLHVLLVKKRLGSLGGLLSSTSITPLLTELRTIFQWVILDFAPAIPMADVGEVLPHVDGALMVVRSAKTSKAMIAPTLEILGSKLCGVVINDAVIEGSAYFGHYGAAPS